MDNNSASNKKRSYKIALTDVMMTAYNHIKAINNEIHKLNIKDPQQAPQDVQDKLKALTLTLTLVNDLIHPAHKISKYMLKESDWPIVDYCINAQRIALESKLVDPCFCHSCKEDKNEAQANTDSKS